MSQKPTSTEKDEGQKGTDEPWKLPGQSSQDPKQTPPPKPDLQQTRARIMKTEEQERETEDDIARRKLGPRGLPGAKDPSKMTPQKKEQTPKPLDPGHTA